MSLGNYHHNPEFKCRFEDWLPNHNLPFMVLEKSTDQNSYLNKSIFPYIEMPPLWHKSRQDYLDAIRFTYNETPYIEYGYLKNPINDISHLGIKFKLPSNSHFTLWGVVSNRTSAINSNSTKKIGFIAKNTLLLNNNSNKLEEKNGFLLNLHTSDQPVSLDLNKTHVNTLATQFDLLSNERRIISFNRNGDASLTKLPKPSLEYLVESNPSDTHLRFLYKKHTDHYQLTFDILKEKKLENHTETVVNASLREALNMENDMMCISQPSNDTAHTLVYTLSSFL